MSPRKTAGATENFPRNNSVQDADRDDQRNRNVVDGEEKFGVEVHEKNRHQGKENLPGLMKLIKNMNKIWINWRFHEVLETSVKTTVSFVMEISSRRRMRLDYLDDG